jgi:hypothetical protein
MQRRIPIPAFCDKPAAGKFDEAVFGLQRVARSVIRQIRNAQMHRGDSRQQQIVCIERGCDRRQSAHQRRRIDLCAVSAAK